MPTVRFVEPDGTLRTCRVPSGQNLMDAALAAGVVGITGQCGGAINCATCLCDVEPGWLPRLPPAHPDEVELLSYVDEATTTSRLACQIIATDALDGLTLRVVTPSAA